MVTLPSRMEDCLANQQVDLLIVLNFHQTNILLLRVCSDFLSRVSIPVKNLARVCDVVDPVKSFFEHNLITMQNLVNVCRTLCEHGKGSKQ